MDASSRFSTVKCISDWRVGSQTLRGDSLRHPQVRDSHPGSPQATVPLMLLTYSIVCGRPYNLVEIHCDTLIYVSHSLKDLYFPWTVSVIPVLYLFFYSGCFETLCCDITQHFNSIF